MMPLFSPGARLKQSLCTCVSVGETTDLANISIYSSTWPGYHGSSRELKRIAEKGRGPQVADYCSTVCWCNCCVPDLAQRRCSAAGSSGRQDNIGLESGLGDPGDPASSSRHLGSCLCWVLQQRRLGDETQPRQKERELKSPSWNRTHTCTRSAVVLKSPTENSSVWTSHSFNIHY